MAPVWMPLKGLSRLCAALGSILGPQALQAPRHHSSLSFNITHLQTFYAKMAAVVFPYSENLFSSWFIVCVVVTDLNKTDLNLRDFYWKKPP